MEKGIFRSGLAGVVWHPRNEGLRGSMIP